jgi:hypothetical protein
MRAHRVWSRRISVKHNRRIEQSSRRQDLFSRSDLHSSGYRTRCRERSAFATATASAPIEAHKLLQKHRGRRQRRCPCAQARRQSCVRRRCLSVARTSTRASVRWRSASRIYLVETPPGALIIRQLTNSAFAITGPHRAPVHTTPRPHLAALLREDAGPVQASSPCLHAWAHLRDVRARTYCSRASADQSPRGDAR